MCLDAKRTQFLTTGHLLQQAATKPVQPKYDNRRLITLRGQSSGVTKHDVILGSMNRSRVRRTM